MPRFPSRDVSLETQPSRDVSMEKAGCLGGRPDSRAGHSQPEPGLEPQPEPVTSHACKHLRTMRCWYEFLRVLVCVHVCIV